MTEAAERVLSLLESRGAEDAAAEVSTEELVAALTADDRRALSRAITLVESTQPEDEARALELLDRCLARGKQALRVGISGPPGVGKSTLIDAFGLCALGRGHKLAVLAVDPSSHKTGGSILGDKTRMARLAARPESFIRPSPSRGMSGGIAPRTHEALLVCEAAGYDLVLVETVGVGQSELGVTDLVDCLIVLVAPGAGDELQGMKRGILEHADLLVVTKADGAERERAEQARSELESALSLFTTEGPREPVLTLSAVEERGVSELYEALQRFAAKARSEGTFEARRREQSLAWFKREIEQGLRARWLSHADLREREAELASAVLEGKATPRGAAHALLRTPAE